MSTGPLTALIPAHNDAYTLDLCLRSIVRHFDEIVVLDDCSTDATPDVVADARASHPHVRYLRHDPPQLGWIEARNLLLAQTDADVLFWLDADDVLFERNAGMLREIAAGDHPVVRLQLAEFWGDFNHTTQRRRHYDRCHCFVNRRSMRDFTWRGGSAARPETSVKAARSDGPLLAHLKGVKPDRRLVERQFFRDWLRQDRPTPTVEEFARLGERDPEWLRERACRMLFRSRQDKMQESYAGGKPYLAEWPARPQVLRRELGRHGHRFYVVYDDEQTPCDRLDRGWRYDPPSTETAA